MFILFNKWLTNKHRETFSYDIMSVTSSCLFHRPLLLISLWSFFGRALMFWILMWLFHVTAATCFCLFGVVRHICGHLSNLSGINLCVAVVVLWSFFVSLVIFHLFAVAFCLLVVGFYFFLVILCPFFTHFLALSACFLFLCGLFVYLGSFLITLCSFYVPVVILLCCLWSLFHFFVVVVSSECCGFVLRFCLSVLVFVCRHSSSVCDRFVTVPGCYLCLRAGFLSVYVDFFMCS